MTHTQNTDTTESVQVAIYKHLKSSRATSFILDSKITIRRHVAYCNRTDSCGSQTTVKLDSTVVLFSTETWFQLKSYTKFENNMFSTFIHEVQLQGRRAGVWCAGNTSRTFGPTIFLILICYAHYDRRRWEDNNKMDLREVGWGGADWIDLAQDRDRLWALE
jgi:hypothetical protein